LPAERSDRGLKILFEMWYGKYVSMLGGRPRISTSAGKKVTLSRWWERVRARRRAGIFRDC